LIKRIFFIYTVLTIIRWLLVSTAIFIAPVVVPTFFLPSFYEVILSLQPVYIVSGLLAMLWAMKSWLVLFLMWTGFSYLAAEKIPLIKKLIRFAEGVIASVAIFLCIYAGVAYVGVARENGKFPFKPQIVCKQFKFNRAGALPTAMSPDGKRVAEINVEGCGKEEIIFHTYLTIHETSQVRDISPTSRVFQLGDVRGSQIRWADNETLEFSFLNKKEIDHQNLPQVYKGIKLNYTSGEKYGPFEKPNSPIQVLRSFEYILKNLLYVSADDTEQGLGSIKIDMSVRRKFFTDKGWRDYQQYMAEHKAIIQTLQKTPDEPLKAVANFTIFSESFSSVDTPSSFNAKGTFGYGVFDAFDLKKKFEIFLTLNQGSIKSPDQMLIDAWSVKFSDVAPFKKALQ
jgi:hypothetical protein